MDGDDPTHKAKKLFIWDSSYLYHDDTLQVGRRDTL